MTVIVVASPKGGVGKTTISILLAEHYAHMGLNVGVVESDNQQHVWQYNEARKTQDIAQNFTLYTDENPDTLGSTIKKADAQHELTIVDLPGFDGQEFTRAVARANLVLIPMSPSIMDSNSAMKAMNKVRIEEEHLDRAINHRVILNMVKDSIKKGKAVAISQTERALRQHIETAQYPRLQSEMSLRQGPYKAFYTFAQTLQEMAVSEGTNSINNAYTEISLIADEILAVLSTKAITNGADE